MKPRRQYVHVIDKRTRKSVHVVPTTHDPAKVAAGMSINLDHERFELSISDSRKEP